MLDKAKSFNRAFAKSKVKMVIDDDDCDLFINLNKNRSNKPVFSIIEDNEIVKIDDAIVFDTNLDCIRAGPTEL